MSITMFDWFIDIVSRISRSIFHWTWRVQTHRKFNTKKKK